jgi:hypothetical protein
MDRGRRSGGVGYKDGDLDRIRRDCEMWQRLGASYVRVTTSGAGLSLAGGSSRGRRLDSSVNCSPVMAAATPWRFSTRHPGDTQT